MILFSNMETSAEYEKAFEFVLAKLGLVQEAKNWLCWNPILCGPPQFRITSLNGVSVPGYENLRWMFLKW